MPTSFLTLVTEMIPSPESLQQMLAICVHVPSAFTVSVHAGQTFFSWHLLPLPENILGPQGAAQPRGQKCQGSHVTCQQFSTNNQWEAADKHPSADGTMQVNGLLRLLDSPA